MSKRVHEDRYRGFVFPETDTKKQQESKRRKFGDEKTVDDIIDLMKDNDKELKCRKIETLTKENQTLTDENCHLKQLELASQKCKDCEILKTDLNRKIEHEQKLVVENKTTEHTEKTIFVSLKPSGKKEINEKSTIEKNIVELKKDRLIENLRNQVTKLEHEKTHFEQLVSQRGKDYTIENEKWLEKYKVAVNRADENFEKVRFKFFSNQYLFFTKEICGYVFTTNFF